MSVDEPSFFHSDFLEAMDVERCVRCRKPEWKEELLRLPSGEYVCVDCYQET